MKVAITGSRGWTEEAPIRARLEQLPPRSFVIHGGAGGVDRIAAVIAVELGHEVRAFPADWRVKPDTPAGAIRRRKDGALYDSRAGILRNAVLIAQAPHAVFAWWDGRSPGTFDCIQRAAVAAIPLEVYIPALATGYEAVVELAERGVPVEVA